MEQPIEEQKALLVHLSIRAFKVFNETRHSHMRRETGHERDSQFILAREKGEKFASRENSWSKMLQYSNFVEPLYLKDEGF